MNNWHAFSLLAVTALVSLGAGACITDTELKAEMTNRLLHEQGFWAVQCDTILNAEQELTSRHGLLLQSFRADIAATKTRRESLFKRLYGDQWRTFLAKDHRLRTRKLLMKGAPGAAFCRAFRVRLSSEPPAQWRAIQDRVRRDFPAVRAGFPGC